LVPLLGCSLAGLPACTSGNRPAPKVTLAGERRFAADCAASFTVAATEWTRGAPYGGGNLYYLNNNFDSDGNLLLGNIAAIPFAGGGPVAFSRTGEVARTYNNGDDGAKSAVQIGDFLYFTGDDRQGLARVPVDTWTGPASALLGSTMESITTDGAQIFANDDDTRDEVRRYAVEEGANGVYLVLKQHRSLGGRIRGLSYFDASASVAGDEYVYASTGAEAGAPRKVHALTADQLEVVRVRDTEGKDLVIPGDAPVYQTVVAAGPGGLVTLAVATVDRIYLYPMRTPTMVCNTPTVLATQSAQVGEQLMRWEDGSAMPAGVYGLALAGEELYVVSGDRLSRLRLTAANVVLGGYGGPLSPLHPPPGAKVGGSGAILRLGGTLSTVALGVNADGTVGYQGVGLRDERFETYADDPMVHDEACGTPELVRIDYEGVTGAGRDMETRTELLAPVQQPALGADFAASHPLGSWSQAGNGERAFIYGAVLRAQQPDGDIKIQLGAYWKPNSCDPPDTCDSRKGCPEGTFRNDTVDPPTCEPLADPACMDHYTKLPDEPRFCGSKSFTFRNYRPPMPPWSTADQWQKHVYPGGEFDWYYTDANQCVLYSWACANPAMKAHYADQMYQGETTGYLQTGCGPGGWYHFGDCYHEAGVCPESPKYPQCPGSETGVVHFRIVTPRRTLECSDVVQAEGSAQTLGTAVIDDQTGEITLEGAGPSVQCKEVKITPCGGHGWGIRLADGTEGYASTDHGSENTAVEAFWATEDTACSAVRVGNGQVRVERCFLPPEILPDRPELPVFQILTRVVNTGSCAGDCDIEFVEQVTWSGGEAAPPASLAPGDPGTSPQGPVVTAGLMATDREREYQVSVHGVSAPPRPSMPPGELLFAGAYQEATAERQTMRVHETAQLLSPTTDPSGELVTGTWSTSSHLSMNTAGGDEYEAPYEQSVAALSDVTFSEKSASRKWSFAPPAHRRWAKAQGLNDLRQVVGLPAKNEQGFVNRYPVALVPYRDVTNGNTNGSASLFVCRDVLLSTGHVFCDRVTGTTCVPKAGARVGGGWFNLWNAKGGKEAQVEIQRTALVAPISFAPRRDDPPVLVRLATDAPDWAGAPLLPAGSAGQDRYASLGVIDPNIRRVNIIRRLGGLIVDNRPVSLNPKMTPAYRTLWRSLNRVWEECVKRGDLSKCAYFEQVDYPGAAIGITLRGWTGGGMSGGPIVTNLSRVVGIVQSADSDYSFSLDDLRGLYKAARALSVTKHCQGVPEFD
jgi:hypothetical protein